MRKGTAERITSEVVVGVAIDLDGEGRRDIATGIAMFDHLLEQFAFYSGCDLRVQARSQDSIAHHLIEDVALTVGTALAQALGERRGIERYACATIPMDDALARVALDLGGRPYVEVDIKISTESVEGLQTILIPHFFRSLTSTALITAHVDVLCGTDPHHCIESVFKAFARACRSAWTSTGARELIPSTKGVL